MGRRRVMRLALLGILIALAVSLCVYVDENASKNLSLNPGTAYEQVDFPPGEWKKMK